jgi:hypothetical protein
MAANGSNSDVIDWHEAMQQCGEDEEFLRELLNDLRSETETQVSNINKTIQVRCLRCVFLDILRFGLDVARCSACVHTFS